LTAGGVSDFDRGSNSPKSKQLALRNNLSSLECGGAYQAELQNLRQSLESLKTPHLSNSTPKGSKKAGPKPLRPKTAEPSRSGVYQRLHSSKTCQKKHNKKQHDLWGVMYSRSSKINHALTQNVLNKSVIERFNSKQFSIEREGSMFDEDDDDSLIDRPATASVVEDEKFHCYMKFSTT